MSRIAIFLLDNLNNTKEEINMQKPKTYQELLVQLRKKIKNLPKYYETYIIGENNEKITINNEDNYKSIEDFLLIKEINSNQLGESLYGYNYKKLSESQQDKLDEKFNCILCSIVIKNENPYLCYQCQKIFHIKCLDNWDKKCKQENKKFFCPNCRNELPKEKWNKKINFEGYRKDNAILMNKINEYKLNINIIKDKKINELKNKGINQNELIKRYETYIKQSIYLLKMILNKINSIHRLLNSQSNNELNNLIESFPLNLENLNIDEISNVINEELELFKNNLKNKNINKLKEEKVLIKEEEKINNVIKNSKILLGNNISQIINNYNKEQITLLKIAVDFYKENNIPQMDFNNEIQINNLINCLFNPNIEFENKTDMFKYITHDKRRKRIKFINNTSFGYLIDIPIFFTKKELYSIAKMYKNCHSTNIILIHKNKILKNDESTFEEISNNDIIWVIEDKLYPDNSYLLSLQNQFYGTQYINITVIYSFGRDFFSLSEEVTIHELLEAITKYKGFALKKCTFTYNAKKLSPDDTRKIKEIASGYLMSIECSIPDVLGYSPFGKMILASSKNAHFGIGTLDPIKNLFILYQGMRKEGKIIIGNVELEYKSENYLSFYGINENFNFIWKKE